ncbi:unnamed protein product (macronuclear) [Paramecium tetraurelia]|uniref:Cytochrome P450 n=1 Tax=Paramecium tetraurelia TaxID=5888 RepID=A0C310_PARTE|nr:uncharacterized protein GSPATT00034655001 [Paramecium tetraurelia]CAK65177.1 unnamed protein product [Paramecium tetraurelia]|eukprot:XP_001432574.1 hypothetical protein (macronuclear) [Paramecium tetraurelia strain d4-2]
MFYLLVVKPLVPMIKLKMQFGDACLMKYHLFGGELWEALKEMKTSKDLFKRHRDLYMNHPYKIFVTNFLWKVRINVADPEYYKLIKFNNINHEYLFNHQISNVIQNGLICQMGEKWRAQRLLLSESFDYDQLKSRLPMINEVCLDKINSIHGENILEFLELITGQVVIRSFFGKSADGVQINKKKIQIEIADLLNELGEVRFKSKYLFVKRFFLGTKSWGFFPTNKEKELLQRISEMRLAIEKLIQKRIVEIELKMDENEDEIKQRETDFLDVLIKEYLKQKKQGTQKITIDEIIQQFITLFFAGTDTTAVLSYHCLYYMAQYPEMQDEIREEVLTICKNESILDDKIKQLHKLSAFINEVLRFKNPALRLMMRFCNQTHQVKDLTIQKGWSVTIDYQFPQWLPKHFPNPEKFDYKRWLEKEPIKENHQFVYLPFSSGPRNCIGQHMALMEAKIILSQILRQYSIEINHDVDSRWTARFLYQLQPGNCVKLQKR